jgi:pyruvate/oxaloacetate carboxyltransferase
VRKLVIGDEQPISCRPADLLEPGMDKARQDVGELARDEQDVISYALFPQVARPFLERRAAGADEHAAVIAAIAASLAVQVDQRPAARPCQKAGQGVNSWKQAWRPSRQWTNL